MDDMILGFKQLTTLRIEEHYIPLFTTILRDASFRLVVLDFHHSTALATGRIAEQQLLEWVDLPALENLKRWRVHSRFKIKTPKGAGARWLAKCMERGIEVRDERRYFTGTLKMRVCLFQPGLIIVSSHRQTEAACQRGTAAKARGGDG